MFLPSNHIACVLLIAVSLIGPSLACDSSDGCSHTGCPPLAPLCLPGPFGTPCFCQSLDKLKEVHPGHEYSVSRTATPIGPITGSVMHLPESIRVKTDSGACFKSITNETDVGSGTVCRYGSGCSACENQCWNAGYRYGFCCDGAWCCCYNSGGQCNRNPNCQLNACGGALASGSPGQVKARGFWRMWLSELPNGGGDQFDLDYDHQQDWKCQVKDFTSEHEDFRSFVAAEVQDGAILELYYGNACQGPHVSIHMADRATIPRVFHVNGLRFNFIQHDGH